MLNKIRIPKELDSINGITIQEGAILSAMSQDENLNTPSAILQSLPILKISNGVVMARILKRMESKGYINRVVLSDRECFELLDKGFDESDGCRFCGTNEIPLDEHHYPVRKAKGGVKVIRLCPNCHRKFHKKTDYGEYVISDHLKGIFNSANNFDD